MRRRKTLCIHFFMSIMTMSIFLAYPNFSAAADPTIDQRLERLERQLEQLRQQTQQAKPLDVTTVEERLDKLERSQPPSQGGETGNMVFFRGGGFFAGSDRSNETFSDVFGAQGFSNGDTGYYVGAGLDLVLSKHLWGMMSDTWALGEIGVEFKRFDSKKATQSGRAAAGGGLTQATVEVTQLTVSVSPKIMFMEGSRFRPWIIPVGLDFHVISPPSNETTVLDIGAQFAVGAQYRIWKAFHLGVDGRYHVAAGQTDTTNDFGSVGAYLGIEF